MTGRERSRGQKKIRIASMRRERERADVREGEVDRERCRETSAMTL